MSKTLFNPKYTTTSTRYEFYAVSKDGRFKEKLKDKKEADKIKEEGKYNFGVNRRECLMAEMECTVYAKQIMRTTQYIEV